jgi:hypothetical protein
MCPLKFARGMSIRRVSFGILDINDEGHYNKQARHLRGNLRDNTKILR